MYNINNTVKQPSRVKHRPEGHTAYRNALTVGMLMGTSLGVDKAEHTPLTIKI